MGQWRQYGDNMRTMWRQHEDNMGAQGCGDHMGTTWRQHGTWGPQGCGDHVGTTWRQHEDNVGTTGICDLLRHPHLWVGVCMVGWISGLMDGSMGGSIHGTRSNH